VLSTLTVVLGGVYLAAPEWIYLLPAANGFQSHA